MYKDRVRERKREREMQGRIERGEKDRELCVCVCVFVCVCVCVCVCLCSQTSGQTELENWITAIHSACAGAVARQHHREDTVRLLRGEIKKLEQKIDMDEKMKKMGDMQLSAVTDNT